MSLPLSVIAHELEGVGVIEEPPQCARRQFDDVRLVGGRPSDPSILYLCDRSTALLESLDEGVSLLYLGSAADKPTATVLSLVGPPSLQSLLATVQDIFLKYRRWEQAMDESLIKDEGIQALVDLSAPFLVNHIDIVDPALKLIAHSQDVPYDDTVTTELIRLGYHSEQSIIKFKLDKRFGVWTSQPGLIINDEKRISKYTTVIRSFKSGETFSVITIMICNVTEPFEYILSLYQLFLKRVEYYVRREYPSGNPSGNATKAFLCDLLDGQIKGENELAERSAFANMPLEGPYCLFYFGLHDTDLPVARLCSDISQRVLPGVTFVYRHAIIVLCSNCRTIDCPHDCVKGPCPLHRVNIGTRIENMLVAYGLFCGRSTSFPHLEQIKTAYLQAKTAYNLITRDIQQRFVHIGERHVVRFDDCYLEHLLDRGTVEDINLIGALRANRILDAVTTYDDEHNTDYYSFLRSYLENERRIAVVAAKTYLHRNNVRYRIDRIEETFKINTDDPQMRFDLLFAYQVRMRSTY